MNGRTLITIAHTVMTTPQWEAFLLVYVQELDYTEAGHRLRIDPGAVQKRCERGIRRLAYHVLDERRNETPEQVARGRTRGGAPQPAPQRRPRHPDAEQEGVAA